MKPALFSMLVTMLLGLSHTGTVSAQINADFAAVPPESTQTDPPEVILSLSRDHQYFFKAYNDYTDLDPEDPTDVDENNNPIIETTYKHSFDYFGYFDSYKCYAHTGGVFNPVSITPKSPDPDAKYCSGNQWSGNFLNWATMTRMDIVRKIFYGGTRSTDTATETVLERSFLPSDAHSFAKYYNGSDIAQLTPFDNFRKNGDAGDPDTELDNIDEGITICNTTVDTGVASQDSTAPPVLRVAEGNYQLWGANERWQCTWLNERGDSGNANRGPSNPVAPPSPFAGLNSGIDAHDNDPVEFNGREFIVRVRACVPGLENEERCKRYPDGNLKPIGLLQTYSDDGLINFGLMTGSYENNIEGGVLRKNTSSLRDEVDVFGNGRFTFTNTSDSIIKFLDLLRPWGYTYSNGVYFGGNSGDNCSFQLIDIPNGRCNSWGNPISEIYKETIRYMAGLNPTNDFGANDTNFLTGLTDADWEDPLTDENQCSDLNTILINASVSSYDDDNNDLNDVDGGINNATVPATNGITADWTDRVGDQEGINGNSFFIGRTATDTDEFCTPKQIDSLSDAKGLCPEAPTVSGSFGMAGIAYYAHNNDIRSDLDGNQTVNTFAISLATNVPIIRIPRTDGGVPVDILPAYRLIRGNGEGGGALVDFKIVKPHTRIPSTNSFTGSYYVNWEDSEQGGDYDQDMWGTINYILNEDDDTIEIETTVFAESTGQPQLFGFVTNGTTRDGFHAYSGIEGANFTSVYADVPGCNNCRPISGGGGSTGQSGPQSHTFDIASSTVGTLESPLYYAAKYGGFEEGRALINDPSNPTGPQIQEPLTLDDQPDELEEWDKLNNVTGLTGSDGLPDNFFFVINPENLFNSLETALNKILSQETASSSAVASFANSNGFENIIVQGTYREQIRGENDTQVSWIGEFTSYFIDEFGIFREDSPSSGTQGKLDGYGIDRAFKFINNATDGPQIQYLNVATDGGSPPKPTLNDLGLPSTTNAEVASVESLNLLWSGGERLRNLNNQDIVLQRNYNTPAPTNPATRGASRYIFTHFDTNLNGRVETGEQRPFLASEIDNNNFGFFATGSEATAEAVVDYVRGFDDPDTTGFRSRTLEIDGENVVYRLGDLVNSTPLVVAGPAENYDTAFDDESYALFKERYEDRRQVAYVGANDGLLHAFNVGFRDIADSEVEYKTTQGSAAAHPLGSEIWAYAPFNLLPHLQWLSSNFYSHVFYVDGSPKAYDVKIFQPSAKHPGGWGTILVVGMRLGGGDFPVMTPAGSSVSKSAYIVIDITDPEDEPEILAEISDPDLNLTTSEPDLFYDCGTNCTDNNQDNNFNGSWQLIFGSGPNNVKTFSTNESAKVFAYNLETKALEKHDVTNSAAGGPVANSFVGSIAVKDWDNGTLGFRNDDVAYFGTVGTRPQIIPPATGTIETGGVYRYIPNSPTVPDDTVNRLIDVDRPVVQPPLLLSREGLGNDILGSWVYFGTGIYLERTDEEINEQESFYGVLEPIDRPALDALSQTSSFSETFEDSELLTYTQVGVNDLLDVSNIELLAEDLTEDPPIQAGDFQSPIALAPGESASNFDELAEFIVNNTQGWFRDLPRGAVAEDPTGRVTDRTIALREQLLFSVFSPASLNRVDICVGADGTSDLFVINQTTGTASPFGTLGENGGVLAVSAFAGIGAASAPTGFTSEALGGNAGKILVQDGDGSVNAPGSDPDNASKSTIDDVSVLRSGWREILQ